MRTLEQTGAECWAQCYLGSGRPTGHLAEEPVRMENGDVAPGWQWVGDMTVREFCEWFEQEERYQVGR